MTDKKITPTDQSGSNKEDKQILDSLNGSSLIDLSNSILAEWKPYLNSEGETILGQEVSFNRAVLLTLQRAVSTREETYRRLLIVSHEQTKQIVELKEKVQIFVLIDRFSFVFCSCELRALASKKTKAGGYLKDGFVVDEDQEVEGDDDDDDDEEDDEFGSCEEDETSENTSYDSGSELSEESYIVEATLCE